MQQSLSFCYNLVDEWKNKPVEKTTEAFDSQVETNKNGMSSLIPTLRTTMDKTEQDDVNPDKTPNSKMKYFVEFPEALHRVDNQ